MPQTRMVDVSAKEETQRTAVAAGRVKLSRDTLNLVKGRKVAKGDVLNAAQLAGIMAAKHTPSLIPLCHPLLISQTDIEFDLGRGSSHIDIKATVKGRGRTGFEMEALTAVAVAALTIYDMCKMYDKGIRITDLRLLKKSGGKSGDYSAD